MVQEGLCASLVVHRMNFGRRVDVNGKRFENEKLPQDKGDVKTEGVKGNNFNRKMSQNKSVEQQVTRQNGAKRKPCQENEMWREENVKRSRPQEKEMPKDKDAKRKSCQRKAAETTSVSRDSDDIRKSLSGEKSVSSLWPQVCRQ